CLYGEWKKRARVSMVVPDFAHNVLDELPQKVLVLGEASNNPPLHFLASAGNFSVSSHPNVVQSVVLDHELMIESKRL
ncbi:hypothetical protein U1Q18_048989, partial [Sarracenia purpurea var. burkii]